MGESKGREMTTSWQGKQAQAGKSRLHYSHGGKSSPLLSCVCLPIWYAKTSSFFRTKSFSPVPPFRFIVWGAMQALFCWLKAAK